MQKIDLNQRFLENLHENIANLKIKTCVSAECHHPLICLNLTPLDIKKKSLDSRFWSLTSRLTKSDPMNTYFEDSHYTIEPLPRSKDLMNEFLDASIKSQGSAREDYFLRETVLSLARLVKSEQLADMRQSINKLIPASLRPRPVRRGRGRRRLFIHSGQSDLLLGRPD